MHRVLPAWAANRSDPASRGAAAWPCPLPQSAKAFRVRGAPARTDRSDCGPIRAGRPPAARAVQASRMPSALWRVPATVNPGPAPARGLHRPAARRHNQARAIASDGSYSHTNETRTLDQIETLPPWLDEVKVADMFSPLPHRVRAAILCASRETSDEHPRRKVQERSLMAWLRCVAFLLLSLLVLTPDRPAAQTPARASFPPAEVPPRNDIRIDNRVAIPMRDGVILYADVYRPVDEGRYPVLVSRTPYSTERSPSAYEAGVYFSRRGYVYVFQDVRGRHESDGRWEPFFDDEKDGYDTIEWSAKQRWSNGKVGMEGGSYLGQNQWRAAQAAPPSLVTIFPSVASTSIYHDWITLNGAWRLSFNFGWGP